MREPAYADLWQAALSRQQRMIVSMLMDAFPRPVVVRKIINELYSEDPNGGAETASQVVRVQISRARKELERFGWSISNAKTGRGNYGEYRLVKHEGKD